MGKKKKAYKQFGNILDMLPTLESEIAEIDRLYGDGWFQQFVELKRLQDATPEQQLESARIYSIHGQTDFFRERSEFLVLQHLVMPSLNGAIKLASVGCSTGEEAYSVLVQNWRDRSRMTIHGYDCNPESIQTARHGTYRMDEYRLDDWAEYGDSGQAYRRIRGKRPMDFQISFTNAARQSVEFRVHNILDSPLPERYEAVLLLNVLCHYTADGRDKILNNVAAGMEDGAWLVCERFHPGPAGHEEYDKWMQDLSAYGLEKQKTVIPFWSEKADHTAFTRTYRRK